MSFPDLARAEKALLSWSDGVSTLTIQELVTAMGVPRTERKQAMNSFCAASSKIFYAKNPREKKRLRRSVTALGEALLPWAGAA